MQVYIEYQRCIRDFFQLNTADEAMMINNYKDDNVTYLDSFRIIKNCPRAYHTYG